MFITFDYFYIIIFKNSNVVLFSVVNCSDFCYISIDFFFSSVLFMSLDKELSGVVMSGSEGRSPL